MLPGGGMTVAPVGLGTMDNVVIGSTTAQSGAFTALTSSSATTLNGTTIPASKTLLVTTDIGSSVQAYDLDLAAIAGLTGTSGFLKKTGVNSWALDTVISSGTVTDVALTAPTGLTVSGSPITTSGTLAITYTSGYSLPTNASQANWDTAYADRLKWDGGATGLVAATGRTSLELGTLATQNANSVSITGGAISGASGSFTTLSASSTVSGTGFSNYLASPPAIGGSSPAAGNFTNLGYTGTLTGGTGVIAIGTNQIYKDASGNVGIGTSSPAYKLDLSTSFDGRARVWFAALAVAGNNSNGTGYQIRTPSSTTDGFVLSNGGNSTEFLRVDSSGNLGLGVTPSAWSGVSNVFQLKGNAYVASTTHVLNHTANAFFNGSNWIYTSNNFASQTEQVSGQHRWFTAPSGTAGSLINGSGSFGDPKMTLTAAGDLLVGYTGTPGQKVSWSGANAGDNSVIWSNVSSTTINLATVFPTLVVSSGATLSVQMQICTSSAPGAASSYFIIGLRNGNSTWAFSSVASATTSGVTVTASGSSNTITLTFSSGGQYGQCKITVISS
jgi:hypothetical protein